ncbi:MAG: ribbon-helix-helix protein, CopG family [Chloroflexi bacterium]|nr:ribbon-helix-helix protein, CopG family [Chloroflexota bacterium]
MEEKERRIMVRAPESLHKAVRVKAAELGQPVSEIVRELLTGWVSGEVKLPKTKENTKEK